MDYCMPQTSCLTSWPIFPKLADPWYCDLQSSCLCLPPLDKKLSQRSCRHWKLLSYCWLQPYSQTFGKGFATGLETLVWDWRLESWRVRYLSSLGRCCTRHRRRERAIWPGWESLCQINFALGWLCYVGGTYKIQSLFNHPGSRHHWEFTVIILTWS